MISPSTVPLASAFNVAPSDLIDALLAEQADLTAVARFSALHDAAAVPAKGLYTDLLPLREPGPGEQYAFEVDLDRCSGCKACVTACHSMNGLDGPDGEETWRSVGLLQKVGDASSQQHVTTACHHCLEPGCAQGCPTLAYEKDPGTGIVRHLDDQCFGCQYCVLKCPYDVPQYHAGKGIVRKCDLCIGRLRAGEAPACAQACPTGAIRVTVVEVAVVREAPAAAFDLPGAPDPARVKPTTRYVSKGGTAKNLVPADAAQVRPEHAHLPLVLMLVASQAAAGYWILLALSRLSAAPPADTFPWPEVLGVLGVQGALGLSLLHLGRPWLAWKAVLGWRRSWLSREVIAFGALAGATALCAALPIMEWFLGIRLPVALRSAVSAGAILSAFAAVYASAMVYRDTPRALWATRATLWRFALTAVITGIPAWLLIAAAFGSAPLRGAFAGFLAPAAAAQLVKLLLESALLRHRDDEDFGPLWKGAQLLFGALRPVWLVRASVGIAGGIALPLALVAGVLPGPIFAWAGIMLSLTLLGELMERFLFFTTAVAPRMPGARR